MRNSHQRIQFYWQGTNTKGQRVEGYIQANRKRVAHVLLELQGITPNRLQRLGGLFARNISKKEIATLLRQISTLLKANLSLIQALQTVKLNQNRPSLRLLVETLEISLQKGFSFAKALSEHPQYFSSLMIDLVSVGEQTSQLELTLMKIVHNEERNLKTKRQFSLMLLYPAFIAFTCISLTMTLSFFILPQLFSFYETFHVELPKMTTYFMHFSNGVKSYGLIVLMQISLLICALRISYQHHQPMREYIDKHVLRIPFLGQMLSKFILIRITGCLSMALSSGLPLLETLEMTKKIIHHTAFEKAVTSIHTAVREGVSLMQSMRSTQRFPADLLEMVAVAEESGQLAQIFSEITNHLEDALTQHTLLWSKLLEPLIMVILGSIIGILLLTLYLPIFQLEVAL